MEWGFFTPLYFLTPIMGVISVLMLVYAIRDYRRNNKPQRHRRRRRPPHLRG